MWGNLQNKFRIILRDNRTRSILKTISYRLVSMLITFIISLLITGSLRIAFMIGGIDVLTKILFYYIHERLWHYSHIGR